MEESENGIFKFKNCKLEFQLEAQSPMLHFQWRQSDTTLRATEVKPKLDRFLLRKWEEKGKIPETLKLDQELKEIFISKEHDSLNYKMKIRAERYTEINLREFKIYYGNMGTENKNKVHGILTTPFITIVCFHSDLRKHIEQNIAEFFLVTNFGTMQNKGFGSFAPKGIGYNTTLSCNQKKEIARYLKKAAGADYCFAMSFNPVSNKQDHLNSNIGIYESMFKEIKNFYSIMKSGRNFNKPYIRSYIYQYIYNYQYIHNQKIDYINEKAWMKQEGISPNAAKLKAYRHIPNEPKPKEGRYVRALLGIGQSISYFKENENGTPSEEKLSISISHTDEENMIERVSSPIFFKIVKNTVFIVAFPIPEELYGKEFKFSREESKVCTIKNDKKSGTILTPKKEDFSKEDNKCIGFDIQNFLQEYIEYYNKKVKPTIKEINTKLEEANV